MDEPLRAERKSEVAILRLSLDVRGVNAAIRGIRRLRERLADPRVWADDLHTGLLDIERRLFDTEGASGDHGAWKPLKYREPPPPILQLTGELRRSLTDARDGNHLWSVAGQGTDITVQFGSRLEKARWHQVGAGKRPIRRVIDPTQDDLDRLGQRVLRAITRRR